MVADEAIGKNDDGNKSSTQNSMVCTPDKVWPNTTIPYSLQPNLSMLTQLIVLCFNTLYTYMYRAGGSENALIG